jgi:sugar phosphate isomerase/epimerase
MRDQLGADLDGTLQRIAELGYREVETAGFDGTTVDIVGRALKRHGLRVPSMHAGYDSLREDLDAVVADAMTLGAAFVVCPSIDAEARRTVDDWKRVCQALGRAGRAVRRHGLTLAYHNHDFEFVALDRGTIPFQLLVGETDPSEVKLELDVYWLAVAGLDPVQSLRDSKDRLVLVHLKDRAADGSTAELGAGVLDIESIVRAALAVGARHLFVEQDESSNPMHSIATSLRFLERLPADVRPRSRD